MIDDYVHTIHVSFVEVKSHDSTTRLVYEFLDRARGTQAQRAALIGVNRSMISLWEKARRDGEVVSVHGDTETALRIAVDRLRGVDPHAHAYGEGLEEAIVRVEELLADLKSLVPREPPSDAELDADRGERATEAKNEDRPSTRPGAKRA